MENEKSPLEKCVRSGCGHQRYTHHKTESDDAPACRECDCPRFQEPEYDEF